MKQRIIVLLASLLFAKAPLLAQNSENYKVMSAEIEKSIWDSTDAVFATNTIPEQYRNESAVVLAEKHTIKTNTKRLRIYGIPSNKMLKEEVMQIFRQKVAINDQNALTEFSELSFSKLDKKSGRSSTGSAIYSFIGIRIIKPDGSVQKINVDESAVTLKETKAGQSNKIAVPNLAIGDIVDYYRALYEQKASYYAGSGAVDADDDLLTFVLSDEYPVVNYAIHVTLDKRAAAEYQSVNGAPEFKISQDDEDNILELTASNLPKAKDIDWTSTYRQLPFVRLRYAFADLYAKEYLIKKGEVIKNTKNYINIEQGLRDGMKKFDDGLSFKSDLILKALRKELENVEASLRKKRPMAIESPDSLVSLQYYLWRQQCFHSSIFNLNDDLQDADRSVDRNVQLGYAIRMDRFYGGKVGADFLTTTSRFSVARENVFQLADLSTLGRIQLLQTNYLYYGNSLYNFGEVPPSLEGETGKYFSMSEERVLRAEKEGYQEGVMRVAKVPALSKEEHSQETKLSISINPLDNQSLNIVREVKAKGQPRRYLQASLLMPEDVVREERAFLGQPTDLVEEYKNSGKRQRNNYEEFVNVLKKARATEKGKFETELGAEINEKVKELTSFKVLNSGLHHLNNVFHMKEEFSVDAWVKKAGNNLILEVGKFVGSQYEVKAEQRERKLDIYMPSARMFSYVVDFDIPEGFTVEGVEKLNKSVENECGGFVSTAAISGNKLVITTKKYYNNSFEKAANWPKFTAFVDAAFEFTKQKVLLKKK